MPAQGALAAGAAPAHNRRPTRRDMDVHPTAVIAEGAELGKGVRVGPYCVIGGSVRLADGCQLHSHVVIDGDTEIGPACEFWPFAVIGTTAQHRDPDHRATDRLRIGAHNRFREAVTVHLGSHKDQGVTAIGNHNLFLAGCHVAHDATIGDHVTMTNGAMAAGHTVIADRAVLGAMVGLHQFARVGRLAMLGAGAMAARDVPPFALVHGDRARVRGVNQMGMRRAGLTLEDIAVVKRAFRQLFWRADALVERIERLRELGDHPLVAEIVTFLQGTRRGVIMARGRGIPTEGHDD